MRTGRTLKLAAALMLLSASPQTAETSYFPDGTWGPPLGRWSVEERAAFYEKWFGGELAGLQERPLGEERQAAKAKTTLRLLTAPSFVSAAMVRLNWSETGDLAFVIKFKAFGDEYAIRKKPRLFIIEGIVNEKQATEILSLLSTLDLLAGGVPSDVFNPDTACLDGTIIVLEIASQDRYAAINRHECEMSSGEPLHRLVQLLDAVGRDKPRAGPERLR